LLRSHGAAVKAYRAEGAHQIGIVVNIEPKYPATNSAADAAAVRRAHAYMNRQYLDPVFFGKYPDEMAEIFGEAWPKFPAKDFDLIKQPIDWLGLNYYTRAVTAHDDSNWPLKAKTVKQEGAIYSDTGWEVYPQGLIDTLMWMKETYGDLPIYITENGSAFPDPAEVTDGKLEDTLRVNYLKAHVRACSDAIRQGVDLRGYMAWSLLDNLEWSLGYSKRFGIVHTNFKTQERTVKDSGKLYAEIIRSNGDILNQP
jgi:beta-glucosidase